MEDGKKMREWKRAREGRGGTPISLWARASVLLLTEFSWGAVSVWLCWIFFLTPPKWNHFSLCSVALISPLQSFSTMDEWQGNKTSGARYCRENDRWRAVSSRSLAGLIRWQTLKFRGVSSSCWLGMYRSTSDSEMFLSLLWSGRDYSVWSFLILAEREIRNASTMEQEVEEDSCSRTGDVCVFEASATGLLRFDRLRFAAWFFKIRGLAVISFTLREGEREREMKETEWHRLIWCTMVQHFVKETPFFFL